MKTENMRRNLSFILILTLIFSSCAPKHVPAKAGSGTLKVMAYNIHHANPPSKPGLIDVDAIVNVLKRESPDIVALQEVDVNVNRSGNINQAREIAEKAGYTSFHFSKAIDYDGGNYGVAILSKFALSDMQTHRLPTDASTNGESRVLSLATVTLPNGKKIKFGSTHLDAQRPDVNRLLQAREINRIAKEVSLPMIIAGDFNATENSEVIKIIQSYFQLTCRNCAPTVPQVNPKRTIDFIAFKPGTAFEVLSHIVIQESYASDHLPVISELQLK